MKYPLYFVPPLLLRAFYFDSSAKSLSTSSDLTNSGVAMQIVRCCNEEVSKVPFDSKCGREAVRVVTIVSLNGQINIDLIFLRMRPRHANENAMSVSC